ncbi:MAG: flagellar assembly protein FliW [Spirochaetales bacterium]|nr:flagellar assembly protein FliW [Spirochaetales bacterium]
MRVMTKAYGEMEVDDRQRIRFPKGLFGFEDIHDYVLLDSAQEPFYWLQAVDNRDVAFVLINPRMFRPDFTLETAAEELEALEILSPEDENLLVFAVVTIPEDSKKMSANLQGPVVINRKVHTGRQVISSDNKWRVKHFILEEMAGTPSC